MRLFVGFDGGGTKTDCVLSDENGHVLGMGSGGPLNYLYCGKDTAAGSVRNALSSAFISAGLKPQRIECAYVSSAAIKTYGGDAHAPFFRSCLDAETVKCEGDIYPVWYAACRNRPAVICISGTGSIVLVCREDKLTRVGGWGPQLGDEGSGYDIGACALRKCLRMQDGRDALDPVFLNEVIKGMNVTDARQLVGLVRGDDGRTRIASAAGIVSRLADNNNETASGIIKYAACELANAVRAALEADGNTDTLELVLSGGMVRTGSPLFNAVSACIGSYTGRISAVSGIEVRPVIAAAALALRECGLNESAERMLAEGNVCVPGMPAK